MALRDEPLTLDRINFEVAAIAHHAPNLSRDDVRPIPRNAVERSEIRERLGGKNPALRFAPCGLRCTILLMPNVLPRCGRPFSVSRFWLNG
jgi:hypothetical protein